MEINSTSINDIIIKTYEKIICDVENKNSPLSS